MEDLKTSTTTNENIIIVAQILTRNSPIFAISNDTPFWTEFCAQIVNMAATTSSSSSSEESTMTTMDPSSNHNPSWRQQKHQQDEQEANSNHSFLTVSPVSGYLAPKGGTTNLCNENERYQDFCQFRLLYPPETTIREMMVSRCDSANENSSSTTTTTTASISATSEDGIVYYHNENYQHHQFLVIETDDKIWIIKIDNI